MELEPLNIKIPSKQTLAKYGLAAAHPETPTLSLARIMLDDTVWEEVREDARANLTSTRWRLYTYKVCMLTRCHGKNSKQRRLTPTRILG